MVVRARWLVFASLLGACQSGAAIGTTCTRDAECSAPLVCRLGRCRSECSENRDCPVGARCLLADGVGSCSLDFDDRCESSGHVCPTGLTCLGDQCVNTCHAPSDCPPDAICSPAVGTGVSFCFATPRDDAGVSDAAMDGGPRQPDASARDASSDGGPCSGAACFEAIDLCVGDAFACAVRGDHHVRCWGSDQQGTLGDGIDAATPHVYPICASGDRCATTPSAVLDGADAPLLALRVACAESTACAVTTDGHVACWGTNDSGQTGSTATGIVARASIVTALPATAPVHAVDIRAMRSVFCAEMTDASEWCWGYDNDDVLQIGVSDAVTPPVEVTAWHGRTLALGMGHICGLGSDHSVICRGNHLLGELGPAYLSTAPPSSGAVIAFTGTTGTPSALAAGQHFSCALIDAGVWCWGGNDTLSLGRAAMNTCGASPCQLEPQELVGLTGIDTLWAEGFDDMVCAVGATTSCWGATDADGCLFAGGACSVPMHVSALDGARQIAGGARSLCAIDATGGVICFGANASGELGNGDMLGTALDSASPAHVCLLDACP